MNKIINFLLKNKFVVWLLIIIVIIVGIYFGFNMKLEIIFDIIILIVIVIMVYFGVILEEVVDKVLKLMEE